MKGKKRVFDILNHIEEAILVFLFAVMVIIIFIQVIMRKANHSLYWSEELGKFLFVWISWLGISIGQRKGERIKISTSWGYLAVVVGCGLMTIRCVASIVTSAKLLAHGKPAESVEQTEEGGAQE